MNMKKIGSFILIVMLTTCTLAQEAQLTWGLPIKPKLVAYNFGMLAMDNQGFSLLSKAPGMFDQNLNVVKFDSKCNFVTSSPVMLAYGDRKLTREFTVKFKEHILVFFSYVDLKAGLKTLVYKEYNPSTLKFSNEVVQVLEVSIKLVPKPQVGDFGYTMSPDSSRIALIYNPPTEKDGMERFGCAVMNEELSLVSNRLDEFPYKDRRFGLYDYSVTNAGVVFLMGRLYEGMKIPFKNEPNYSYSVMRVAPDNTPPVIINVNLDPLFITHLRTTCDFNGDLFAAGFYSERGESSIKGTLCVKINGTTGEVIKSSHQEIPIELITAGMSEKKAERIEAKAGKGGDVEMDDYDLDDLLARPDNGLYLVAEQTYSKTTTTRYSNGTTSTHTTYYAKNIIVMGMSPDGSIDMVSAVLKNQRETDSRAHISYVLTMKGSDLYFLFNDHPINNAPHPKTTVVATLGKTGVVTIAKVDPKGVVTRRSLYTFDKQPCYLLPYQCMHTPTNDLILMTQRGMSKYCMGSLEIK